MTTTEEDSDTDSEYEEEEEEIDTDSEYEEETTLYEWLEENHAASCTVSLEVDQQGGVEASAMVEGEFYVDYNAEQGLDRFLRTNTKTQIVELCLDGHWGEPSVEWARDSLNDLLKAFCQRPSLVELSLQGSGSAEMLSRLVHSAKHLETLELYDVHLEGDASNFQTLADTFRNHSCLKEVNSFYMDIATEYSSNDASTCMDQLLQAILQAPAIECIGIWAQPKPEEELFSTDTLLKACSSPALTALCLIGVWSSTNQREEAVAQMAVALEQNKVLRCLTLGLRLDPTTGTALARIIQRNKALESIRINISQAPMAIRRNQQSMVDLANALRDNRTLTKLKLVGEMKAVQLDDRVLQAYEDLFGRNYRLQELVLLDYDEDQRGAIDFYLSLNRNNRQQVLSTALHNTQKWLETIARDELDLTTVFYYLSQNPSIVSAFTS